MDRHYDKNKLRFKFYIPSNLGLVNVYKIEVIDKVKRKTKQLRQKVSHIVVDFLNRNGESILTSLYLDKNVFAILSLYLVKLL